MCRFSGLIGNHQKDQKHGPTTDHHYRRCNLIETYLSAHILNNAFCVTGSVIITREMSFSEDLKRWIATDAVFLTQIFLGITVDVNLNFVKFSLKTGNSSYHRDSYNIHHP